MFQLQMLATAVVDWATIASDGADSMKEVIIAVIGAIAVPVIAITAIKKGWGMLIGFIRRA